MVTRIIWLGKWLIASVWTPLLLKGALGIGAFAAVAHIGAGTVAELRAPPLPLVPPGQVAPSATVATAVATAPSASAREGRCPKKGSAWTEDGKLRLNLATVDDLVKLPQIGRKRAEAILALRERLGRFRSVRDLMRVRGIGYRSIKRLTPLVVVVPVASLQRPRPPGTLR